jgi:hypothetical protein
VVLLWGKPLASWLLAIDEHSGHEDLRGSDRRSVIPYVHERTELYCSNLYEPESFLFLTSWKWRLPESFITQGRVVYNEPKARQVASGQVKPYAIGLTARSSK